MSRRLLPSIAALVLVAAGAFGALAANAELPDEASDTAHSQLADLNADETPDGDGDGDGENGDGENGEGDNGDVTGLDVPDPTHGEVVSTFAQETELEGCERGQAIASVARGDATPEEAETADYSDPCDNGDDDGEIELDGDETDGNGDETDGNGDETDGNGDETDGNGDETDGNGDDETVGTAGDENRGDHDEEFGRETADERSGGRSGGPDADQDDEED